jgi:hypothetical protein
MPKNKKKAGWAEEDVSGGLNKFVHFCGLYYSFVYPKSIFRE